MLFLPARALAQVALAQVALAQVASAATALHTASAALPLPAWLLPGLPPGLPWGLPFVAVLAALALGPMLA
ncbi:MAG: hypothetical protein ACREFT_17870, partial [Acetobacteraceae bacterium]